MNATREPVLLDFAAFAIIVTTFFIFGGTWGWRVAGLFMAVGGIWTIRTRSVPVGIEGRRPSFHVRGNAAIVVGVLALLGGAIIILLAEHMPGLQ